MDLDVQAILTTARLMAIKRFGHLPDALERIADVESFAWEMSLTASEDAKPGSIGRFACRRVAIRRQFAESVRCLETIPKDKRACRHEFRRVLFDARGYASKRGNPAEIAAFRIDFPAWLASLKPQQQQVAKMLLVAWRTRSNRQTRAKFRPELPRNLPIPQAAASYAGGRPSSAAISSRV